jgi:hypothetical protein
MRRGRLPSRSFEAVGWMRKPQALLLGHLSGQESERVFGVAPLCALGCTGQWRAEQRTGSLHLPSLADVPGLNYSVNRF